MKIIKIVLSVLAFFLILLSCEGEKKDKMLDQDTVIENFVNTLEDRYKDTISVRYSGGVTRVVFDKGDTTNAINAGDSIAFYYVAYVLYSSSPVVFETNVKSVAIQAGLDAVSRKFEPKLGIAGKGHFLDGLDKGLLMCHNREYSYIIFNSDLGFGASGVGMVPEYAPLLYEVSIERVKKN